MLSYNYKFNSSMSIENQSLLRYLPNICRICGALAKYLYCDVITCQSCKMFFKRNAQREQVSIKF